MTASPPTQIRNYDAVAPFYDRLAQLYSLGAIDRSRRQHLARLPAQSQVLYPGGGSGQEALIAAQQGHRVQLWEPSEAMFQRAQARRAQLDKASQERLCLVQSKAEELPPELQFDAIVCNYFLNLFSPEEQYWWLERLALHLKPGGSLWIADFAPVAGPFAGLQWLYHALPMACFRLWTHNAKHDPYDYGQIFERAGWKAEKLPPVRLARIGPPWFGCWRGQPG